MRAYNRMASYYTRNRELDPFSQQEIYRRKQTDQLLVQWDRVYGIDVQLANKAMYLEYIRNYRRKRGPGLNLERIIDY